MSRHRRQARRRLRLAGGSVVLVIASVAAWIWWPRGEAAPDRPAAEIESDLDQTANAGTEAPVPAAPDESVLALAERPTAQPPLGTTSPPPPDTDPGDATRDLDENREAATPPPPPVPAPSPPLAVLTEDAPDDADDEPLPRPDDGIEPNASPARRRTLQRIDTARASAAANDPVTARTLLSEALAAGTLTPTEAAAVRAELEQINARLVFGPDVAPNDPYAMRYVVQPGDSLERIVRRLSLQVDWRFIQRINGISRPERIQAGQQIKLITGPFHAVVHKAAYRMDLYLGDNSTREFVCSFPVGLGETDSTPEGLFRVRPRSKVVNPGWVNPRTRERFAPDDPANPIGEHWIGLEGLEESIHGLTAYGIHGTVEPESIGRQMSMGCVRMLPEDVAVVYEMLVEGSSTIEIVANGR